MINTELVADTLIRADLAYITSIKHLLDSFYGDSVDILSVDTSPRERGLAKVIVTYKVSGEIKTSSLEDRWICSGMIPKEIYETKEVGGFELNPIASGDKLIKTIINIQDKIAENIRMPEHQTETNKLETAAKADETKAASMTSLDRILKQRKILDDALHTVKGNTEESKLCRQYIVGQIEALDFVIRLLD